MSQSKSDLMPVTLNITFADASNLPIHHVNALDLRTGVDEFYFTLGVVMPPNQPEIAAATEIDHLIAQPLFRFAISRDTMAKFLPVMAGQYDQQTTLIRQLLGLSEETSEEAVG